MPRSANKKTTPNGRNADTQANIGYEERLWKAADTLLPKLLSGELRVAA